MLYYHIFFKGFTITIYDLKPKFQALLRPIVISLVKKGITANQVTIFALFLSLVGGFIVYFSLYNTLFLITIPLIMFIRMALNAIDGMIAKEHNMITKKGSVLNELCDVLSDIFLYVPFIVFLDPYLVIAFVLLAIISEFLGVLLQAVYNDRRYDGPMGKSDRSFLFGLLSLLIIFNIDIFILNILVSIGIILLLKTNYNRYTRGVS